MARNPASASSVSHPKEYQRWPTLRMESCSAHSTAQMIIQPQSGARSTTPTTASPANTMPTQQHAAKNRSL